MHFNTLDTHLTNPRILSYNETVLKNIYFLSKSIKLLNTMPSSAKMFP